MQGKKGGKVPEKLRKFCSARKVWRIILRVDEAIYLREMMHRVKEARSYGILVSPGKYIQMVSRARRPIFPETLISFRWLCASVSHKRRQMKTIGRLWGTTTSSPSPTAAAPAPAVVEEEEETVPTVFRWEHGGRQVYVTGTFNNWQRQIPMHRSGNDFTYIHNLQKGKHAFKFVVDDEWRFAPDQPTVADVEGRINNFIDVSQFVGYLGEELYVKKEAGEYARAIPDLDEYTKDPPPLPPHLRHIILNKPSPAGSDATSLPVPQHVALNHLYCTAIKDGLMVLGVTLRYRQKATTTVYYSCS